ncbi:SDR family NAD(P)-dependent oxidoreductase [Flavobacteriaceae bacterium R38]|nr:SDR family NAD(P)-dependent oxidoreductase [Flavobacteriaceae bacterium R38]
MKKVLITGADGFIGSHLVEEMIQYGYNVRAFCFYNSFNSYGWLDTLKPEIKNQIDFYLGDVRDYQSVKNAVKDCDTIIHLAALISIPYSYQAPDSFIKTNITGTLNVLQAALENELDNIVVASTSEIYGTAMSVPIEEIHPVQPQSPYAASKVGADALAMSYHRSYGLNVSIARPFNTFGPRQSTRAIIPTIITQLLEGKEDIFLGSLVPTRDFLYVKDTAKALIAIAKQHDIGGEVFNICSGNEISISDLSEVLIKKINPNASVSEDKQRLRPEKSEVFRLIGDASKLTAKTLWKPEYSFENALQNTIDWFSISENLEKYQADRYTI